jgi:PilZ domain
MDCPVKSDTAVLRRPTGIELRRHDRVSVHIPAVVHCHGRYQKITIIDASQSGIRIRGCFGLFVGDRLMVEVPGTSLLSAKVGWAQADICGCSFLELVAADHQLLHQGVVASDRLDRRRLSLSHGTSASPE